WLPPAEARPGASSAAAATAKNATETRRIGSGLREDARRVAEMLLRSLDERRDLAGRRTGFDPGAQLRRDRVLEVLHQRLVGLLERPFDVLEVLEVRVGDKLVGLLPFAGAVSREGRIELPAHLADLGDRLRRRTSLLVPLRPAATGDADRESRDQRHRHRPHSSLCIKLKYSLRHL